MRLFLICCLFLCSCVKVKEKNQSDPSPAEEAPVETVSQTISTYQTYQVVTLEKPNQYAVQLHLDTSVNKVIRVNVDQPQDIKEFDFLDSEFIDTEVQAGQSYDYTLVQQNGATFTIIATYSVAVPQDYVFDGQVVINDKNHPLLVNSYNRYFWLPQASLVTNGYKIKFQFSEMIMTENNVLMTFPAAQKAPVSSIGRSGGDVEFIGRSAQGTLRFEMRGENGGDGMYGAPYSERAMAGAAGTDVQLHISFSTKPSSPHNRCMYGQPGPGQNGMPGAHGRHGEKGKMGGSAGQLFLDIQDTSQFTSDIISEPGDGGEGGAGSQGQQGGLGGRPGGGFYMDKSPLKEEAINNYINHFSTEAYPGCILPPAGQNGADGLPGEKGSPGSPGSALRFCTKNLSGEKICH